MRQPVEACFGYGAARLPICAVPYPSRSATLPLWAGLGYLVGELFQAHSWTGLRRAATSTGIFALFTVLAIATALTVVQSDPETGGVQIVAFQTPEPKPAELVAPPEPSPSRSQAEAGPPSTAVPREGGSRARAGTEAPGHPAEGSRGSEGCAETEACCQAGGQTAGASAGQTRTPH